MGVEYTHYFVTADEHWMPSEDTARKVVEVLKRWNLLPEEEPECFHVFENKVKRAKPDYDSHPRHGRLFRFDWIEGKAIEDAFGASYDGGDPADRYIQSMMLILGTDIKVQASTQELDFQVESPPIENGRELISHAELHDFSRFPDYYYAETYSTASSSVFPKVTMKGHLKTMKDHSFNGFWRGALIVDFGKCLPRFCAGDVPYAIENQKLLQELEIAFQGNLVEIGSVG